jgi:hypothetical protein
MEVTCRACGLARFPGRDGEFVVKCFLLRHGGRRRQRGACTTLIRPDNGFDARPNISSPLKLPFRSRDGPSSI